MDDFNICNTYDDLAMVGFLQGIKLLRTMPDGWGILKGALTNPHGSVWVSNGKSLFERDKNGNRTYKHALMIVDEDIFNKRVKA